MLVGQFCSTTKAFKGESARQILSTFLTVLLKEKKTEAFRAASANLSLVEVPEGVIFEVVHICGEEEAYEEGTAIMTVTGVAENASIEAKEFAKKYDWWSIPASPRSIKNNFSVIGKKKS